VVTSLTRLRSSWTWLLLLFTFASFIETVFYGQLSAFTPFYLPKLGVPPDQVTLWTGLIASAAGLLGLPLLPLWGALADRYSRQPIIVRSYLVHFLAGAVIVLASNIWVFLVGRAITSLALGNSGLMMTTLSERAPAQRRGFAFAIMNSAGPVGVFVGPLVGGPIVDQWGFRVLLAVDALLMLIVVLSLTFGYSDDFHGTDRGPLLKMALDSVRLVFDSRRLRRLFPALFLLFAGWMLSLTYVPLAVRQLYRGPDIGTAVGVILGAGGLLAMIIAPLLGALADRVGHWRVLLAGSLIETLLWPLPALTSNLFAFGLTWTLISGLSSSVFAISFTVLAASASSQVRGRVMSFAYLPVNVGIIVGPLLGSLVTRQSVFAVFPVAALLTGLGVGMLVLARRTSQPVV
jgi:DHA1 family multidrug resistance protein-like MFS transporter